MDEIAADHYPRLRHQPNVMPKIDLTVNHGDYRVDGGPYLHNTPDVTPDGHTPNTGQTGRIEADR